MTEKRICPKCNGYGKVKFHDLFTVNQETYWVPCPECKKTTSHILNEAFDYINKTGLAAHIGISDDELMALLKTLQLKQGGE